MKWQISAIIIFALLLTPGVLGAWNADNHDLQNTSATRELGPAPPLKFLWDPDNMNIGWNWLTPIVHGNVAYLVQNFMYDFNITAVNITDGKILWIDNNTNMNVGMGCTYAYLHNNTLYFDSKYTIGAINATTGKMVWAIRMLHSYMFVDNFLYGTGKIYVVISYTENESKGNVSLLEINAQTGQNESSVPIRGLYGHLYYDDYMAMNGETLYVYNTDSYVAAFNIKNGTMKWSYQAPNPLVYVNRGTLILGNNTVYMPDIARGTIGIIALNASTGRVLWRRGLDHSCGFFRYTFAYSPEYHMIVRVNETGNLIALDSRTGKVMWVANRTYDGISTSLEATPVIAKNYIYVYGDGLNLTSEYPNQVVCGILRLYNITTGKIVYQMKLPPVQGEDSLELPDIAVSNGEVLVPNVNFYVLVHGTTGEEPQDNVWMYATIGAIAAVIIAVVSVIIEKDRRKK